VAGDELFIPHFASRLPRREAMAISLDGAGAELQWPHNVQRYMPSSEFGRHRHDAPVQCD
jgi:hypothetical protein